MVENATLFSGTLVPTMPRPVTFVLLGMLLPGCPVFDRADCTVDRGACPQGTTCDLRSGICVRLEGQGVADGQSGKDDASRGVGSPETRTGDAGAGRDGAVNSAAGASAGTDGGPATR